MAPIITKFKNPYSYLPRRLQIVVSVLLFALFATISLAWFPSIDEGRPLHATQERVQHVTQNIWSPFRKPVHAPPKQSNSSDEETSWLADWKWLRPFSSSTTYEENRLVLPPEPARVPVYTYYASKTTKNAKIKEAEHALLLIWRRAWWAKGFKPVVLGEAEAKQNPRYAQLHNANAGKLEAELMRWLAWSTMGTGILVNWLAIPMTTYADSTLVFLRRGEYPQLTWYEDLRDGVFVGEKAAIDKVVETALLAEDFTANDMIGHVSKKLLKPERDHGAIAYYNMANIETNYAEIAKSLKSSTESDRTDGMSQLPRLIDAHLHNTWQNIFFSGIAVLKPAPDHMTATITSAKDLGKRLAWCSSSSLPVSCPPNLPKCKPCQGIQKMPLTLTKAIRTVDARRFLIGVVPHPYTFNALTHHILNPTVRYMRRKTARDQFITHVSGGLADVGTNTFAQLVKLKELVASSEAQSRSIWMTAERKHDEHWREDLAWLFGFTIPDKPGPTGVSDDPVPKLGSEDDNDPGFEDPSSLKAPDPQDVEGEESILEHCRGVIRTHTFRKSERAIREAVEAWNLADTELWRFVRAFNARRRVEREKWESDERAFAGSETRTWGRWLDTNTGDDTRM